MSEAIHAPGGASAAHAAVENNTHKIFHFWQSLGKVVKVSVLSAGISAEVTKM